MTLANREQHSTPIERRPVSDIRDYPPLSELADIIRRYKRFYGLNTAEAIRAITQDLKIAY